MIPLPPVDLVERVNIITGNKSSMLLNIPREQAQAWLEAWNGTDWSRAHCPPVHIAFPHLTDAEQLFLLTGITPGLREQLAEQIRRIDTLTSAVGENA